MRSAAREAMVRDAASPDTALLSASCHMVRAYGDNGPLVADWSGAVFNDAFVSANADFLDEGIWNSAAIWPNESAWNDPESEPNVTALDALDAWLAETIPPPFRWR